MPSTAQPRRPVMAANWKMHKTGGEAAEFLAELGALVEGASGACEIVIAPPFTALAEARAGVRAMAAGLAGQNMHWEAAGAFTGEISAGMLVAAGCSHVILGHSERRQLFGETDQTVQQKLLAALDAGLQAIVCVGETQQQRAAGETEAVLRRQFEGAFRGVAGAAVRGCILAYEPVWAIGTGNTATPAVAQAAHAHLRGCVAAAYGAATAAAVRILYGGSIQSDNVEALMQQPDLDGGLVGGASLAPGSFAALIQACRSRQQHPGR